MRLAPGAVLLLADERVRVPSGDVGAGGDTVARRPAGHLVYAGAAARVEGGAAGHLPRVAPAAIRGSRRRLRGGRSRAGRRGRHGAQFDELHTRSPSRTRSQILEGAAEAPLKRAETRDGTHRGAGPHRRRTATAGPRWHGASVMYLFAERPARADVRLCAARPRRTSRVAAMHRRLRAPLRSWAFQR